MNLEHKLIYRVIENYAPYYLNASTIRVPTATPCLYKALTMDLTSSAIASRCLITI
jgi:hypothetical protein